MKMTGVTLLVSHVERSGGVHATGSRGIRSLVVVSGEVQGVVAVDKRNCLRRGTQIQRRAVFVINLDADACRATRARGVVQHASFARRRVA